MSKQGYLIIANNSETQDYLACAHTLAASIRHWDSQRPIAVITNVSLDQVSSELFDQVISSSPNRQGFSSDLDVYDLTPWTETFKIESDVIITRPLDSWWSSCQNHDLVIAQGCYNYFGQSSDVRYYRIMNDANFLPDLYNGLTYFKKSERAQEFFNLVTLLFTEWNSIKSDLPYNIEDEPTTDTVYALAAQLIGREHCTLPPSVNPISWVHMKAQINYLLEEQWSRQCIVEHGPDHFRINTYAQFKPVHYCDKMMSEQLGARYGI